MDGDSISTQSRTYACTNISGDVRALTYSQNGTATETDKDHNDATSGYRFEYDIVGSHSEGESWAYKGFWDLTKNATTLIYSSDFSGTFTNTRAGAGTYGGTWSHTITPTDMAHPYTAGGALEFSGFYAYNFTESSVVTNYVFKMTSTGLTYGATPCSNFYNGGSYSFTDASANTVTVTFAACGTSPTVKYNSATI